MTDRLELAERVEAASGPDRELDALIHEVFGLPFEMEYWSEADTTPQRNLSKVPHYTASLDAAMTLVPDGWNWGVWMRHDWREQNAQVWHPARDASTLHGYAATPALALCAASLRARASAKEQSR